MRNSQATLTGSDGITVLVPVVATASVDFTTGVARITPAGTTADPQYVATASEASAAPNGDQFGVALSGVTTLTPSAGAKRALVQVEGAAVRWTIDGSTPSASRGALLPPMTATGGSELGLTVDPAVFKMFAVSGTPTFNAIYTK